MISQGEKIREPFRRGLGYAAQWLDGLQVLVEQKVEESLIVSDQTLRQADAPPALQKGGEEESDIVECTRVLRQLCPACFGGVSFGRPLEEYVLPPSTY